LNTTLIKLTDAVTKLDLFIDAACIQRIVKEQVTTRGQTPNTLIVTYQITPQGQSVSFTVLETPEEAARLVNAGRQGKDLTIS
jgi:hypothetical protein